MHSGNACDCPNLEPDAVMRVLVEKRNTAMNLPNLEFRHDGYFYRMVSAALVSLSGHMHICIFNKDNIANLKPGDWLVLTGFVSGDRHFLPHDIRAEALSGGISVNDYLGSVCMMLVNIAYESVKDRNDGSPGFEFFRHVRNASSHFNRFKFFPDEPRREASWRGVSIDHQLKGKSNPLNDDYCFGKMLGVADVFQLLWDIEQIILKSPR
jgi:hypothetical protein